MHSCLLNSLEQIIERERVKSQIQRERLDREIDILRSCNHPNIVKLVETFESDLEISLVMELYARFPTHTLLTLYRMEGGDLFDRILAKGVFTEEEARTAMYNIFSALDYLHDRSIVHRDLKVFIPPIFPLNKFACSQRTCYTHQKKILQY